MSVDDNVEHVAAFQWLEDAPGVLKDGLLRVLKGTFFSNRPSVLPSMLPSLATELGASYARYLQETGEPGAVPELGSRLARQGLGQPSLLRLGVALRKICITRSAPEHQQSALAATEAYMEALLGGYLEQREQIILSEQEQIREALQKAVDQSTLQMGTTSEIARAASSILEPSVLLETVVNLIRERLNLYYVGIFLLDDAGEWAVLRAGTGEPGELMLERGHRLQVGGDSMIGQCLQHREARVALDVGDEAVRFDNPLLPDTHSEMALPLVSRDQVLGAMTIQAMRRAAFSADDVTVYQMMADQLANAIENAHLFVETERSLSETAALYAAASDINAANSFSDIVAALRKHTITGEADIVTSVNDFDRPWTATERPEWIRELASWTPHGLTDSRERYALDQFPSAYTFLKPDAAALIYDIETDPRLDEAARQLYRGEFQARSLIIVPLVAGERWIGYIDALYSEPQEFGEAEVRLLMSLASQAAVVVQLLLSLEEARSSSTLLQTVISAIPNPIFYKDMRGAYRIVNEAFAQEVLGLPRERIEGATVFDLTEVIPSDLAEAYHEADMQLIQNPGLQEYEAQVRFADGDLHTVLFNKTALTDVDGKVRGMVGVMLDVTERKRAEEERERLVTQLERRAVQLQTASEIAQAASSILNMEDLLNAAVNLIRERFDLYYVGLFLVDDTGRWAILRAGTGAAGRRMLEAGHRLLVGGDSMIGQSISAQGARIALDVGEAAVHFSNPLLPQTRSELALPLVSRGEAIGAMTIQSEAEAAFSEADIAVLETMGRQLANAIENAKLFSEARTRLEDLQQLQRQLTGESWRRYAGKQQVLGYSYDLSQLLPLDQPLVSTELSELAEGEVVARQQDGHSALLAPLTVHNEPIGVMRFEEFEEAREWTDDDIALVEAVREQLALALENRLLYEQTQEALAETNALYEIGRRIGAVRTIDDTFSALIEGLQERIEIDQILVGVFEPLEGPETIQIAAHWSRDAEASPQPQPEYPLIYWQDLYEMLQDENHVSTADVEAEERFEDLYRAVFQPLRVHGLAALRLQVRSMLYGVVLLHTQTPYAFGADELQFYGTVVRTAAVALENQLLLQTTQQEAERRAFLNEVMRTASSSLDPEDLMIDVGAVLAEHFEMPVLLWQWEGRRAFIVSAHDAQGQPLTFEEPLRFLPSEMPGVGASIRSGEPLLWSFREQAFGAEAYQALVKRLELQEVFSVPLLIREEVLGGITLGRQLGHPPIDGEEMVILRNAAVNVSVALENARLYRDAQETAEKLKEVDRLKSEFLANMSHELRTPLNSIIGFSRVILKGIDGPLTEMQQTDLSAIHESGKHLLNLINDVLDLSKIEAGKMEFVYEPTDLRKVISGVLSTAIALVKEKPVELQQDVPEEVPVILADERRIRQVILNLVGNAAKFTDEGFIRVAAIHDDREVIITVEDSGVGIPEEKFDEVFAEFRQVDSSSTRRYGGTGLGLPVSKKFVEAHGGRIWFTSHVGEGTTFYVALPIHGPEAPEPEPEQLEEGDGQRRTVLTIDDDEGVLTLFRRYLTAEGYHVVGLTRAERAVEEVRRLQPYAITLDILMPGQDGWQVIRELKSHPDTRDVPIVVCSIVSDKDKGLSMGVADYLVKPILEQDLLLALERLATSNGRQRVLVVDDSPDDRHLLCRILEDASYEVDIATGGAEAVDKIHETLPDAVVLDLMMPDIDGFAVLENLKANERTREIPVIVVTAKELTLAERELLQMRVEALLQKGLFDQQQLLQDVGLALDRLSLGQGG